MYFRKHWAVVVLLFTAVAFSLVFEVRAPFPWRPKKRYDRLSSSDETRKQTDSAPVSRTDSETDLSLSTAASGAASTSQSNSNDADDFRIRKAMQVQSSRFALNSMRDICLNNRQDSNIQPGDFFSSFDFPITDSSLKKKRAEIKSIFFLLQTVETFKACMNLIFIPAHSQDSVAALPPSGCPREYVDILLETNVTNSDDSKLTRNPSIFPPEVFQIFNDFYLSSDVGDKRDPRKRHRLEYCLEQFITPRGNDLLMLLSMLYSIARVKFFEDKIASSEFLPILNKILFDQDVSFEGADFGEARFQNARLIDHILNTNTLDRLLDTAKVSHSFSKYALLQVPNQDVDVFYTPDENFYRVDNIAVAGYYLPYPMMLQLEAMRLQKSMRRMGDKFSTNIQTVLFDMAKKINSLCLPALPFTLESLFRTIYDSGEFQIEPTKKRIRKIYSRLSSRSRAFVKLAAALKVILVKSNLWGYVHPKKFSPMQRLVYSLVVPKSIARRSDSITLTLADMLVQNDNQPLSQWLELVMPSIIIDIELETLYPNLADEILSTPKNTRFSKFFEKNGWDYPGSSRSSSSSSRST